MDTGSTHAAHGAPCTPTARRLLVHSRALRPQSSDSESSATCILASGCAGASGRPRATTTDSTNDGDAPNEGVASQRERGINGDNSTFASFEQVPKLKYNLTESKGDEYDDEFRFATCDVHEVLHHDGLDSIMRLGRILGPALEKIGFAVLTGHTLSAALEARAHTEIEQLFVDLPPHEKEKFTAARKGSVNQGYFAMEQTSNLHPDQVEGWVFCRRAFRLPKGAGSAKHPADVTHFWPGKHGPAQVEPVFRSVVEELQKLVLPVMRAILWYLGEDPYSFDSKLRDSNFGLRLNYYPPMSKSALDKGAGRMLGHEDVDLFTLLPAAPVEGLQVLNRENKKWIRMQPAPGSIILNVGDYLQRISNDRLPSTTHRVAPPRDPALLTRARTSIPMAVYVDEDCPLECLVSCGAPKYTTEKAIDFHTKITAKYYGDSYRLSGED